MTNKLLLIKVSCSLEAETLDNNNSCYNSCMELICIFMGGALGALLRYLILLMFGDYPANVIGVFLTNMLGCFVIGFVTYLAIKKHNFFGENVKKFLITGFAGGFTTFSAFTHPVLEMFLRHHYVYACLNKFFSVIVGLIFVSWGMNCAYYTISYLIRSGKIVYRQEYNG